MLRELGRDGAGKAWEIAEVEYLEGGEVANGWRDGADEVLVVSDGESGDAAGGVIALDVVPGAAVDVGGPRIREGVRGERVLEGKEGGQIPLVAGRGDGD